MSGNSYWKTREKAIDDHTDNDRRYCSCFDTTWASDIQSYRSDVYDDFNEQHTGSETETYSEEEYDEVVYGQNRQVRDLADFIQVADETFIATKDLEKKNVLLKSKIKTLESDLSLAEMKIMQLEQIVDTMHATSQINEERCCQLKKEKQNLEESLKQKQHQQNSLYRKNIQLQQTNENMYDDFVNEKREREESFRKWQRNFIEKCQDEIYICLSFDKSNMKVTQPGYRDMRKESQFLVLDGRLSASQQRQRIVTESERENNSTMLQVQIDKLTTENKKLLQENESSKRRDEAARHRINAMDECLKKQRQEIDYLKEQGNLEENNRRQNQKQKELLRLKQKKLEEDFSHRLETVNKHKDFQTNKTMLQIQIDKLKTEKEELLQEKEASKRRDEAARQRIEEMDECLKKQRQEIDYLKEQGSLEKNNRRQIETKIELLTLEKKKLEEDFSYRLETANKRKELQNNQTMLEGQIDNLKTEKKELLQENESLKRREEAARQRIDKMDKRLKKHRQEIDYLKEQGSLEENNRRQNQKQIELLTLEKKKLDEEFSHRLETANKHKDFQTSQTMLQVQIDKLKSEKKELLQENESSKRRDEAARQRIEEMDERLKKQRQELDYLKEQGSLEENNRRQNQKQIELLTLEKTKLEEDFSHRLETANKHREFQKQKAEEMMIQVQKELKLLQDEKKKLTQEFIQVEEDRRKAEDNFVSREQNMKSKIDNQNAEIDKLQRANEDLKKRQNNVSGKQTDDSNRSTFKELQQQLQNAREQLTKTQKELDEAKSRLSRAMGDRLTDNNPNIADLSDKNRPTKISERFQELYDNQWTDAFEVVNVSFNDEDKAISVLKRILINAMDFCKKEGVKQMKKVTDVFAKGKVIPLSMMKPLNDYRKTLGELYGQGLYKEYLEILRNSHSEEAKLAMKIQSFVKECFEVCWLMVVQDPPVVIGPEVRSGESFSKDHYKAYTKSGDKIEFIVWPVLLLHQNGPVLCKGVAQGK